MKYSLYKLIPPRPTFPKDMTDIEEELMHEHFNYWKDLADRRIAIVYGPVEDPKGMYGSSDYRNRRRDYCTGYKGQ